MLEARRLREDLTDVFQILKGYENIDQEVFLWSPYGIGHTIAFLPCGFFFFFLSFFFFLA